MPATWSVFRLISTFVRDYYVIGQKENNNFINADKLVVSRMPLF